MSASPKYKIFTAGGDYIASCKEPELSVRIVAMLGKGAAVKFAGKPVFRQCVDGDAHASIDQAAAKLLENEQAIHQRAYERATQGVTTSTTSFVIRVGYPRDVLAGQFLQGPRDPKKVRRDGYGFTFDPSEAWPFSSVESAAAKARIVAKHMGWGEGFLAIEPQPDSGQ